MIDVVRLDLLDRIAVDAITTLGSGVDGAVRRIEYGYDGAGNVNLITTYNAVTCGTVVNQIQRVFNGLGQLTIANGSRGGASRRWEFQS